MQAVNRANIVTINCDRKRKSRKNGLYALLISRKAGIIGLVKPSLPKSTMKPLVIATHYRNFISKSYNYMCI